LLHPVGLKPTFPWSSLLHISFPIFQLPKKSFNKMSPSTSPQVHYSSNRVLFCNFLARNNIDLCRQELGAAWQGNCLPPSRFNLHSAPVYLLQTRARRIS
jgi:hypothetical protein